MKTRKTFAGALAVTVALSAASIAWAEADHDAGKLGGSVLTATWEGTGSGVVFDQGVADDAGCQPVAHECHDTLIEVTEPGTLTVKTSSNDPKTVDTDLQLFSATAAGETKDEMQESAQPLPTPDEQVSARVKEGFYIARIDFTGTPPTSAVQAEAALKPSGTATPAPGPGTTPGPSQDAPPSVKAAKPGSKKVRKFKGTASSDTVKVEVGILKLKGKSCQDVTAAGKTTAHEGECTQPNVWFAAKGTTKWTATIKRKLKQGKYVLFARATDAAGQTQGGYGKDNRKAFTVKK